MRILVVHPRMSVLGGAERVAIHSLIAGLRAGHDVGLLSENFDPTTVERYFACEGLFSKVQRLTYPTFKPKLVGSLLLYRQLCYHHRRIQKLLSRRSDFQLLLSTQDIGYVPSTTAKVIHYCYFPGYFSHIETGSPSRWWGLYYWPARRYYDSRLNHVDELLSTSDYTKESIRKAWGRESTTLYPPCPVDMYKSRGQAKENLAVTVARIVPEKRIEDFFEIARKLPSTKFVVIGRVQPGKEKYFDLLKRRGPANVSFLNVPLREASDIIARAKAYVHCARNEQFGITIVEAMSAGCIPIVHDSGGPREIVTQDIGYRWTNIPEATQQISTVLRESGLQKTMSMAASQRASLFSEERFETSLLKMFPSQDTQ